jgi:hypothetical protein
LVRFLGGVAGIRRLLLFKLFGGPPFGHHEPFIRHLLFGNLHRDLGDAAGDGRIPLLEDDSAHRPNGLLLVRRLEGAEEGGLQQEVNLLLIRKEDNKF